jgi:hypothetical protein
MHLPTSVIKEIRLQDRGDLAAFIEITENCDEVEVLRKFTYWIEEHAAQAPPSKKWNNLTGFKRPLFIPALVSFARGINGEFIVGLKISFWNDCSMSVARRIMATQRWLYRELNECDKITIPKIVEEDEYENFYNQFDGANWPANSGEING